MSKELAKSYDPRAEEPAIRALWDEKNAFHVEGIANDSHVARYSVVIPPPNVTAALHLGHAFNNTIQDVLVRYHRMLGEATLWMPGTDHAGIATQAVVEKRILQEEGKRRKDLGATEAEAREKFVARTMAWKDEYERTILEQLKLMGCSCDWDRTRFTMDEMCAKAVREAFFQLFKAGLIYRGKRLVNWDPALQTAVADDETDNVEVEGFFYYLRYPLVPDAGNSVYEKQTGLNHVTVATTRPETMLGDMAVALNPKDPRAAALRGRKVRLPIVNRVAPIIEDDYVVLPVKYGGDPTDVKAQMATGCLKVTPAHDFNDYDLWRRHEKEMAGVAGGGLINILSPSAAISKDHGWPEEDWARVDDFARGLLGMDREKARAEVTAWFAKAGLLEDKKPFVHSVPISDRSKAVIEPYLSDQWFVGVKRPLQRQTDGTWAVMQPESEWGKQPVLDETDVPVDSLAGFALRAMAKRRRSENPQNRNEGEYIGIGEMKFYPSRYAKTFENWHVNIRDWCISRQLWWGHRIPVWTFTPSITRWLSHGTPFTDYLKDDKFCSQIEHSLEAFGHAFNGLESGSFFVRADPTILRFFICARNNKAAQALEALHVYMTTQRATEMGPGADLLAHLASLPLANNEEAKQLAHELRELLQVIETQDSDVLDTWFSSALWPMSTMGWPNPEAFAETKARDGRANLLESYNPTDTLCTAREIITLWVSRMTMFNVFFLNRLPFRDVCIHAMIQDGEGRKMSKSLGNGVDPRDIIATKGTDAMRFTLAQMATQTQDVRMPVEKDAETGQNTSPKFEIGRRLCNKVWNATKFAMMNLQTPAEAKADAALADIDRWMLSRLATTEREVKGALGQYEFSNYAQQMYDLFWRDFCDWYVEAIKPTVKASAVQQRVLRGALGAIHRMWHPIMPFITERLHESIEALPVRPIEGVELPASELAATARWPKVDERFIDARIEGEFDRLRRLVEAIREARSVHTVHEKRKVTLHIADEETMRLVTQTFPGIAEALAGLGAVHPLAEGAKPAESVIVAVDGRQHVLSDLKEALDAGAEAERKAKRRGELEKKVTMLRGRLSNEGYVARAPAKLVEETKTELANAERELATL